MTNRHAFVLIFAPPWIGMPPDLPPGKGKSRACGFTKRHAGREREHTAATGE